ncbi:unnamed protein product [Sphagnum jensenii]|uniref:F-box domain-containing protein n=1 Tax=Sphagnum jensenii TaxID=128206 RepID=A0ABP1B238_9BRYO
MPQKRDYCLFSDAVISPAMELYAGNDFLQSIDRKRRRIVQGSKNSTGRSWTSVHRKMQHESPDAHHEQKYKVVVVRGGDKSPKSSIQRSDLRRAGEASEQFDKTFVQSVKEGTMCTHTFESTQGKIQNLLMRPHEGRNKRLAPSNLDCNTNWKDEESGHSNLVIQEGRQELSAEQTTDYGKLEASICWQLSPRLDPHTQQFGALNGVGEGNLGAKVQQMGTRRQPVGDISAIAAEVDLDHGKKRPRVPRTEEYAGEESARDREISVRCQLLCLPDDIQSIVFAKLPLANVYKLQTSCRQLRTITHCESFKQARVHEFPLERSYSPMFFSVHEDVLEMAGYDVDSGEWCPLPSLKCLPSSPDPGLLKEFLVAGAEGLLCINVGKAAASGAPKLIICNPLTQKTRQLPAMNFPRHPVLMHLIVDTKKNSYKVIVAGSSTFGTEHLSRKTEVYCSETESWQETGDLPGPDFGLNEYQNGAYSNGVLYCVALSGDTCGKVVLAYHVAKGIWLPEWHCPIPTFRSNAYFATTQIVGLGGSIFVFSEQEYLKEVKFSIEKLEFIEMKSQKSQKERWRCNPEIPEHLEGSSEGARKQDQMWSTLMKNHTDPNSWERVLTEKKVGKWTNLLQEPKQGSRGLMVYPEHTCVAQGSKNKLCIFNTVERSMIIHDLESNCRQTIQTTPLRKCKKKFHSLNPLAFTFTPNFNVAV